MKHLLNSLPLLFLVSAFLTVAQAGLLKDSRAAATIGYPPIAVSATGKSPQPEPPPLLTVGDPCQVNPRTYASSNATLAPDQLALQSISVSPLADAFINQFAQGVYLRYRPRDPTSS